MVKENILFEGHPRTVYEVKGLGASRGRKGGQGYRGNHRATVGSDLQKIFGGSSHIHKEAAEQQRLREQTIRQSRLEIIVKHCKDHKNGGGAKISDLLDEETLQLLYSDNKDADNN